MPKLRGNEPILGLNINSPIHGDDLDHNMVLYSTSLSMSQRIFIACLPIERPVSHLLIHENELLYMSN
jgi:hypothetical protein